MNERIDFNAWGKKGKRETQKTATEKNDALRAINST